MSEKNIEIPTSLPAMTLRGVVLFPSAMMPLRIFEERYRQMLDDVLVQDRMFVIAREREDVLAEEVDQELPYNIATVGLVRISKKHDDGTSFVLLQGLHRVRINSISQEEPYRILDIEPLDTVVEETVSEVRTQIIKSLETNSKLGGLASEEILEMLSPLDDPCSFVDIAAHHICRDTDDKQDMLEQESLHKRAQLLLGIINAENEKLSFFNQTLGEKGQDDIDSN